MAFLWTTLFESGVVWDCLINILSDNVVSLHWLKPKNSYVIQNIIIYFYVECGAIKFWVQILLRCPYRRSKGRRLHRKNEIMDFWGLLCESAIDVTRFHPCFFKECYLASYDITLYYVGWAWLSLYVGTVVKRFNLMEEVAMRCITSCQAMFLINKSGEDVTSLKISGPKIIYKKSPLHK